MASTPRKIYRTGAQHVGRLVPELLHKSQERFGFAYGGMLTQWNAIVGEDLAATTRPERIRWPRRQTGDARIGGTLVIRVDGPSAIEVQHSTPAIVERINAFYGYDAVAGIKIVQGRVTGKRPPRRRRDASLPPERERKLVEATSGVSDGDLQTALQNLGRNIIVAKT